MITYQNVSRCPAAFNNLFGCTVAAFDALYAEFAAAHAERLAQSTLTRKRATPRKRKMGAGRRFKHSLRDRLLLALFWLRVYPTLELLGLFFSLDKTSAEDNLKDVLATLEIMACFVLEHPGGNRRKLHTPEEVLDAFPDVALGLLPHESIVPQPVRFYNGIAFPRQHLLSPQHGRSIRCSLQQKGEHSMATITTQDGTQLYYKDWGTGQPVVFSHGWPLSADAWEDQMMFLASHGYRCIAHDRRGHGRSSQPWNGNDMDTYADDLATLVQTLDLNNAIHVGHSTGGGEVARYIGRHGTKRVAKAVLISAIPPLMLKTAANPGGLPIEVFDGLRASVLADRSQFWKDLSAPFYGANRPGSKVSQGLRDSFWLQGMMAGINASYDCIKVFSETDHTEDLKKFDVPTLIIHGDDDQIVPIGAAAMLSSKIVKGAILKVYPGAPHGLPSTLKEQVNTDLLAFCKA
jgi:non-heme chloroperoxidase